MSARASLLRQCALALVAHAARVLPASRSPWAEAMRNEVHHIEGDGKAFRWAAGCVLAGYVERSRVSALLRTWQARGLLSLLILTQALSFLFATALTAAYRLRSLRLAAFLGGFTPGDDYRRFIPLMEATPFWLHALWVAASVSFLVSAWLLLKNRPAAFSAFAAGWILGTAGNLISQSMPACREAFSFPAPSLMRDGIIPAAAALLPLLLAAALGAHARRLPAPGDRQ